MKKLLLTSLSLALTLPLLAQDAKPTPEPPAGTVATITSYQILVGQQLTYDTMIALDKKTPNMLTPTQEQVSVVAINDDRSTTIFVKLFKRGDKNLELLDQGTLTWNPIPDTVLEKLFKANKDLLRNEVVIVDEQAISCIVVPISVAKEGHILQAAWIAVDKDRKCVFPGIVKMTLRRDNGNVINLMELKKIEQPSKPTKPDEKK
jgi:hypothetical protein